MLVVLTGWLVWTSGVVSSQDAPTREDAARMERKIAGILERGLQAPSRPLAPLRTAFSDREVNAYFRFSAKDQLPTGVVAPEVVTADAGRVTARAIVDLDAIRRAKSQGVFDFLLTGSVAVRASGILRGAGGRGTFTLESASLGGIPVPKSLLQEIVTYYTRSAELPAGFNLDEPFTLPHRIRQVDISRGSAVVIQ